MMSEKIAMQEELLKVRGLVSGFETDRGIIRAVDGVSFEIEKGKTTGVVGESGCGKTVTAMSIVDLLPKPSGQILDGSICLNGNLSSRKIRITHLRRNCPSPDQRI